MAETNKASAPWGRIVAYMIMAVVVAGVIWFVVGREPPARYDAPPPAKKTPN
jgi:cytochrome b